jgi:hypothetical protein
MDSASAISSLRPASHDHFQGGVRVSRYLEISFVDEGVTARAELLETAAPITCRTIWDVLPLAGRATHAKYSGTTVAHYIDPTLVVPAENATTYIQTGDLMYTHYDAGVRHGYPEPLSEVYWAYDRYARPTIPGVGLPATANVFGRIIGDVDAFYEVCRRTANEGAKRIEIRRVEE